MSGGEPIPMATSAAATPHGTNALARAANRVISYLNIQRVPHREVGSHRDRWVHREDTPHIYMYIAHTSQGGLSIHHRALTVRYAFHMPCVPYREGCLYTHLLPCKIPHVYIYTQCAYLTGRSASAISRANCLVSTTVYITSGNCVIGAWKN
jgi:hypothetical protein